MQRWYAIQQSGWQDRCRDTSQEFMEFLTGVVERAAAREVHIILDNLSAHKSQVVSTPTQTTLSRSSGDIPIRSAAFALTSSLPHATSSSQIVIVMRCVRAPSPEKG